MIAYPPLDALEEFKVQTSVSDAEFGRAAGGIVNLRMKSGGRQVHGDLFEFLRNSALDAKNFFDSGAMQGKASYTKAAGDLKLTEHRITRDPDPQTLCQDLRLFQPGLRHQHNELIASVPCNHVGLADLLLQQPAYARQHQVAFQMTLLIVHVLELIQIDHHY